MDGTEGAIVRAGRETADSAAASSAVASSPEGEVAAHLKARRSLIRRLRSISGKTAKTPEELSTKALAISALGNLRAKEATQTLVMQIAFKDPNATAEEEKAYPSVAALVSIGKAGSDMALRTISRAAEPIMASEEAKAGFLLRIKLLTAVIHHVEGPELTKNLLQREMRKASLQNRSTIEKALEFLAGM